MTVTGLTTVNISTTTGWQQAILFFLMMIGNLSAVSMTMVWVRRHFFRKKFDAVIRNNAEARKRARDVEEAHHLERRKNLIRLRKRLGLQHRRRHHTEGDISDAESPDGGIHKDGGGGGGHDRSPGLSSTSTSSTDRIAEAQIKAEKAEREAAAKRKKQKKGPLRADMIKRIDQPAVLINPMGMPSEGHPQQHEEDNAGAGSGGGILNTSNDAAADAAPAPAPNDSSNQPSIRISLPPGHSQRPSAANVFTDAPAISESPANLSWSEAPASASVESPTTFRTPFVTSPGALSEEPETATSAVSPDESLLGPLPMRNPPRTRFEAEGQSSDNTSYTYRRRTSDPTGADRTHSRRGSESGLNTRFGPTGDAPHNQLALPTAAAFEDRMPRSQTIQYAEPPRIDPQDRIGSMAQHNERAYTTGVFPKVPTGQFGVPRQRTFERTPTQYSSGYRGLPLTKTITSSKERGFGGFPTPIEIASKGISKAFPKARDRFVRSTTMQRSATIASTHSFNRTNTEGQRSAPYLSFDANVYGNSLFHSLTETQRDELGGVEYRALDLLAKVVPIYWVSVQLFMIILVAPYCASPAFNKYRPVFESQGEYAPNTTWFWFFQVVSAYTNTGLSLIDTSMSQMADAYMLLIPMAFLILVGNTGYPIFLRFWIWTYSKCLPKTSRSYETVRFILDHPRRCFVYLFPAGQTWFLFFILLVLNCIDWVAFEVLDIGNPTIESIPVPQRIFDGLFQSIAVRAAGFQVISLLSVAPAVQFLYVIMMYISAYPLALSVRSTNVYEERSLGVYTEAPKEQEEQLAAGVSSPSGWGTYLAAHARRQLAFDIWWLGFALWLVCIIERAAIQDPATNGWFTVFSCLFELTSAYGTVGLSTGTPTDAFSLSGRFKVLSKLVVIATMLRGRHRGLPVAIDRSILLPTELEHQDAATEAWSVVDPDARSAYRGDGTSMDDGARSFGGGNYASAGTSFTRVATQPALASDGEEDRGGGGGGGDMGGSHALAPMMSGGSVRQSSDQRRSMTAPLDASPTMQQQHYHHGHTPGPAEAFQLDPIQEKREGVATPQGGEQQQERIGAQGGILASAGDPPSPSFTRARTRSSSAERPTGSIRRHRAAGSIGSAHSRKSEHELAEMYGSGEPRLVSSREKES